MPEGVSTTPEREFVLIRLAGVSEGLACMAADTDFSGLLVCVLMFVAKIVCTAAASCSEMLSSSCCELPAGASHVLLASWSQHWLISTAGLRC